MVNSSVKRTKTKKTKQKNKNKKRTVLNALKKHLRVKKSPIRLFAFSCFLCVFSTFYAFLCVKQKKTVFLCAEKTSKLFMHVKNI